MDINPNTQLLHLTVAEYIELHKVVTGQKKEICQEQWDIRQDVRHLKKL